MKNNNYISGNYHRDSLNKMCYADHLPKKSIYKNFSRPRSYASRLIRVCFGSNLRLRWASDWLRPRLALDKQLFKYTNNVFNLLHIFLFTVLIHVLSIVHVLLGWRNINMPGERIFLLTPSINSFYKLNSVKSWVF